MKVFDSRQCIFITMSIIYLTLLSSKPVLQLVPKLVNVELLIFNVPSSSESNDPNFHILNIKCQCVCAKIIAFAVPKEKSTNYISYPSFFMFRTQKKNVIILKFSQVFHILFFCKLYDPLSTKARGTIIQSFLG